jgi:hypothetical protein
MNNNSIAYGEDSFLLIKKELETIIRDMGGF